MARGDQNTRIAVYDFFCGCGGTSRGFQKAGMDIVFALDIDRDAKSTFTKNFPETVFCDKSITELSILDLQQPLDNHKEKFQVILRLRPLPAIHEAKHGKPER